MTFSRISRLRGCGIFRDFSWPSELLEFGHCNLIYGGNWSGKTTISRMFRAVEMRTIPAVGEVTFSIDGHEVRGDAFAQQTLPVRVFNRDFVVESVFPVGSGGVPPIFVVGKESVERQIEADKLKARRVEVTKELESIRAKKRSADKDLDNFCIARAQVIKDTLRSTGANPYNNYNKGDFRNRAQEIMANSDVANHQLAESNRNKLLTQARANSKPTLATIDRQLPALRPIADSVSQLLSTTVVSAALQALKENPTLSAWTRSCFTPPGKRRAMSLL